MPSDTICICSILNDFVTSEAEAFSNLAQMKAELDGMSSKVLIRRLWKKDASQWKAS